MGFAARGGSSPLHRIDALGSRGRSCFSRAGNERPVDARRVGDAGLVGLRGRLGARAATWLAQRTPFDERTLKTIVGAYLFVSRSRRMVQMLARLRRRL